MGSGLHVSTSTESRCLGQLASLYCHHLERFQAGKRYHQEYAQSVSPNQGQKPHCPFSELYCLLWLESPCLSCSELLYNCLVHFLFDISNNIFSYLSDDWESIFGNVTKFGLGLVTIFFDSVFLIQHYILYRGKAGYETMKDAEIKVTPSDTTSLNKSGQGLQAEWNARPIKTYQLVCVFFFPSLVFCSETCMHKHYSLCLHIKSQMISYVLGNRKFGPSKWPFGGLGAYKFLCKICPTKVAGGQDLSRSLRKGMTVIYRYSTFRQKCFSRYML